MENQNNVKVSKVKVNIKSRRWAKVLSIVIVIAIIAGASGFSAYKYISNKNKSSNVQTQRTAVVSRGDITVTVTGSGPIESAQSTDLTSTVSSTITAVNFKDGDRVKKGDVIFELENTDAKDKVDSIKSQIDDITSSISDVQDQIKNLTITAPISGIVKNFNLNSGDRVANGSNIATIIDPSTLKVKVSFPAAIYGKVKDGMPVLFYIQDIAQPIQGNITYIGNSIYTNEYGSRVFDVEAQVQNPGAIQEGMTASLQVTIDGQDYMSVSSAALEYAQKAVLKAQADGQVDVINIKNNQYVQKGTLILRLKNDDYQKQLKNYQQQLKNLQDQLKEAQNNLENYYIKAPFDGIVTNINFKKGDNIKAGEVLATVFDDKNLEFRVDIDELDIAKIKVGQKVNITVDALPETQTNPLTGKVSKIPLEGTTQNGVTTYPVTISIENPKDLKIGMNANAEIIVDQKQDVLRVPLEAVQKFGNRYFVFVKTSSSTSDHIQNQESSWQQNESLSNNSLMSRFGSRFNSTQSSQSQVQSSNSQQQNGLNTQRSRRVERLLENSYYKGSVLRSVEVGINNDQYIEIVSGLNEGDIVILPPLATSSTSTNTQSQQGFNMFGGFGGFGGGGPGEFRQFRQNRSSTQSSTGSSSQSSQSSGQAGNLNR
ncbi:efflux RND transporter periplasmic adaptor subunit [Anaerocellum diazotrophicum]|uniref:Efflux transporter, RND family, MFP subunit n=1 Tax=Caldicellulosiruptor diazotrophicus TaxID=2806205 RepID=A0ABN6E899_9FIRM|nr:HlyD family efflux transporter periplasmic adaptor subunit [Caldicellulosiruptor diazotrophicus]BCS80329.1 hypothetical protein CaldiYA01_02890 [Caldicellulosiruptor diazotrophicus]